MCTLVSLHHILLSAVYTSRRPEQHVRVCASVADTNHQEEDPSNEVWAVVRQIEAEADNLAAALELVGE